MVSKGIESFDYRRSTVLSRCQSLKVAMLTHPILLKLARVGLDLTQRELADAAGLSLRSVINIEKKEFTGSVSVQTYATIQKTLENRGVVFLSASETHGPGLRLPSEQLAKTPGLA
jgi:DNA-binding XRE family transcriptional regulator